MVRMPTIKDDTISFIAMSRDGYRMGTYKGGAATLNDSEVDELAVGVGGNDQWVEETGLQSNIVSTHSARIEVVRAESPVLTTDGKRMAFLREYGGRGQLWIHDIGMPDVKDRPLTAASFNVFEMSFWGNDRVIFAADIRGDGPHLYTVDIDGNVQLLSEGRVRYPSVSPDGKWLAYSRLDRGYWNLWISELGGERTIRITNAECNSMEPAWDNDSASLVYASDCGRALWFTALIKRRVLP
jgi:Tol biopolymer transport system component